MKEAEKLIDKNGNLIHEDEYSYEDISLIYREQNPEKREKLARDILTFNRDISQFAAVSNDSNEDLELHASTNAGFHDYDRNTFVTKRKLSDLCVLYRVFFENDPAFSTFLNKVKEYAELDPYSHENYEKEVQFVRELPKQIAKMEELLDKEEERFQKDLERDKLKYDRAGERRKAEYDHKYVLRSETLDNRRRALASFSFYFENLTKGDLSDIEDREDTVFYQNDKVISVQDAIKEFNMQEPGDVPKHMTFTRKHFGREQKVTYINAAGVNLDADLKTDESYDEEKRTRVEGANNSIRIRDMRDDPVFPHEPRMTDIDQSLSGNCYLLAGLQNIARLYPEKIRNMITDNGDGTATVRFYTRETDPTGKFRVYNPVYVRVDKTIPNIDQPGTGDRMARDCLWVNLIEKAYAMSGFHDTWLKKDNIPVDPSKDEYKNWKPSLLSIEGGSATYFLENILGEQGTRQRIKAPTLEQLQEGMSSKSETDFDPESIRYVDQNNAESVAKHAFYKVYKKNNGTMPEQDFMKLDEIGLVDVMKKQFQDMFGDRIEKKNYGHIVEGMYSSLCNNGQKIIDKRNENPNLTHRDFIDTTTKTAFKYYKMWFKSIKMPDGDRAVFNGIIKTIEEGFREANNTGKVSENKSEELKESFYSSIIEALDKGYSVSFGSRSKGKTAIMAANHAYSIVGSYATDDVPPKFYFRVKNPWTKTSGSNGIEYVEENGVLKGKWVNVKEGIFDVMLDDFIRDVDVVNINGNMSLEHTPHVKYEGYDVITTKDKKKYQENTVTSDKLTDYMKVANDLYDAMVSTDSVFSNDSREYKSLEKGIKEYRHKLAQYLGRDIKDLKQLTEPLMKQVEAYEKHVNEELLGPSKRQRARKRVCSSVRSMVELIDSGRNPQQEYEKGYAKKLIENYYKTHDMKKPDNINEISERMYKNKVFRNIANSTNTVILQYPLPSQMKNHLEVIERRLKGRGLDKDVDIATMQKKSKPLRKV